MDKYKLSLSTPREIDEKVKGFCENISLDGKLLYVDTVTYIKSISGKCFQNAESYIKEFGGKKVIGWKIWRCKNIYLQAESHAIVKTEKGNMVDVSPHDDGDQVLFFYYEKLQTLRGPISSQYFALSDSILVKNFIGFKKEIEELEGFRDGSFVLDDSMLDKYAAYMIAFARPKSEDEFCSCESNLKYKNCCGKYI